MIVEHHSREDWEALPPKKVEPMKHPIKHVIYSIENSVDPCQHKIACAVAVKDVQRFYMKNGFDDIPYNFIVGNDGNIYEGRGWNNKAGPSIFKRDIQPAPDDSTLNIGVICGHKTITKENLDMVYYAYRTAKEVTKIGLKDKLISEDYTYSGMTDDIEDDYL